MRVQRRPPAQCAAIALQREVVYIRIPPPNFIGPRMPGHYQGVETTHTSNRTTAVRKHTANTLPRFDAARATH